MLWKGVVNAFTYYQIKTQLAGAAAEMEVLRSIRGGISPDLVIYGLTTIGLFTAFFAGPLAALLTLDSREPTKRVIFETENLEKKPE